MARILIVDDMIDSCEPLERILRKAGHEVQCVPNGHEALESVINSPPDVVILDLLMPVMDGPSFLEVVRSYLRIQRLPVVVLTAISDGPLVERARKAGVYSILLKGKATNSDIQLAVENAIQQGQRARL